MFINKKRQLKRDAVSEYDRNVVALGEMERQTAELFEPARASFRLSRNEL